MWISNLIYEEGATYKGRSLMLIAGEQEGRRGGNIGNWGGIDDVYS